MMEACLVLCQQRDLETIIFGAFIPQIPAQKNFHANNANHGPLPIWQLFVVLCNALHKLECTHHVAKVCDGKGWLTIRSSLSNHFRYF